MKQYGKNSSLKLIGKALEGYTLAGDSIRKITEDETGYTIHNLDGTADHYDTEAELIAQLEEYADLFRVDEE